MSGAIFTSIPDGFALHFGIVFFTKTRHKTTTIVKSRVQRQLLSTLEGPTQFSLKVPSGTSPISYGALFSELKASHDATLFGVAETSLGEDLILNASSEHRVESGMILYFMAAQRIEPAQIDWRALYAQ